MGTVEDLVVRNDLALWDGSLGEGVELRVNATLALEDAYVGCSIAVNGVCLTATQLNSNSVCERKINI
jgi:riboflavin synthase